MIIADEDFNLWKHCHLKIDAPVYSIYKVVCVGIVSVHTLCVCVCVCVCCACVCSNMLDITHLTLAIHTCSKDVSDIMWMSSIITCLLLSSLCLFPSSNIKLNGSTGEGKYSVPGGICILRVLHENTVSDTALYTSDLFPVCHISFTAKQSKPQQALQTGPL